MRGGDNNKITWCKERWLEFRWGHTQYIAYVLSLSNFVIIFYRLLIEYVKPLAELFPTLLWFTVVVMVVYPPIAIMVGHLHRKKQLHTELRVTAEENPIYKKLIDVQKTQNEILEVLNANTKSP